MDDFPLLQIIMSLRGGGEVRHLIGINFLLGANQSQLSIRKYACNFCCDKKLCL